MVLFPIEDLRQAVETAKGILTKEKIGRQLVGELSSTPFMNIWNGYNNSKKVVTFDTQDRLDDNLEQITSTMSKLTAQASSQNRPFKPKIYQGKRRGQARNYYHQDRYQTGYRSNSRDRGMSYRGRAQYGQNYGGRSQYDQNNRSDFRRGNCNGTQNYRGQNFRSQCRGNFKKKSLEEVEVGLEKDSIQVILE